MADGVDAGMDAVHTTSGKTTLDRSALEPEGDELPAGDHALLAGRKDGESALTGFLSAWLA